MIRCLLCPDHPNMGPATYRMHLHQQHPEAAGEWATWPDGTVVALTPRLERTLP